MSQWLRRARVTVVTHCVAAGGVDILSATERRLANVVLQLVDKLEQIETLADVLNHGLPIPVLTPLYFATASDLRRLSVALNAQRRLEAA